MNLKSRVEKMEQRRKETSNFAIIAVDAGETRETAYLRYYPDESKIPKAVIYATALDILL